MSLFLTFNDIFAKSFVKFFMKSFVNFFTYLEVLCSRFVDVAKRCYCNGWHIYTRYGGGGGAYILFVTKSK